jgi:hypothetical protein
VNQTEETTQINNTINLLSTKTEYSRYIIFEPIPGVHPTRFSVAEDALQDTKDNTKATGGQVFDSENKSMPCHKTLADACPL